jgi:hypothetical protein
LAPFNPAPVPDNTPGAASAAFAQQTRQGTKLTKNTKDTKEKESFAHKPCSFSALGALGGKQFFPARPASARTSL